MYTAWNKKPIAIGRLQRHATEGALKLGAPALYGRAAPTGKRVAIVGAGPASPRVCGVLGDRGARRDRVREGALPGGLEYDERRCTL